MSPPQVLSLLVIKGMSEKNKRREISNIYTSSLALYHLNIPLIAATLS